MQRIPIGSQVRSLSIPRADVAAGTKARVILLDPNPAVKQCSFMTYKEGDVERGRMVEFDEESMIRYRVRPRPIYYFLVARVICDHQLRPISSDVTIEYLQMSANQYQELVDRISADGGEVNFNTAVLSKEKRVNEKGQDVSTVKAAFGHIKLDPALQEKIDSITGNQSLMEGIWNMLDAQTSMSVKEWEDFCNSNGLPASGSQRTKTPGLPPKPAPARAVEAPKEEVPMISGSTGIETGDEFDDFTDGDFS